MNDPIGESSQSTVDRRRFLVRAATLAWSTPVILTVLAQSAAASHADGCIHLNAECGVYNNSTKTCEDNPASSGSTGSCCDPSTVSCQPTVRRQGQPCTCQD